MNERLRIWSLIIRNRFTFVNARNYLTRNKIVFETIVAVLLSIMAITISYGAHQALLYQTQIMEQQNYIMEQENQPEFSFIFEKRIDPPSYYLEQLNKEEDYTRIRSNDGDLVDGQLVIKNTGKPFGEIRYVRYSIFADITYDCEHDMQSKFVRIPIEDFSPEDIVTDSNGDTAIPCFWGDGNITSQKFSKVIENYAQYAESQGDYVLKVKIMRYIIINYKDILGNEHTKYYYIIFNGNRQLSNEEYERNIKTMKDTTYAIYPEQILFFYSVDNETWQDISHNEYYEELYQAMHDSKKYGLYN